MSASVNTTAQRTALWRALHLLQDDQPYVFHDDWALRLAAPDPQWTERPDMSAFTRPFRASILARSRYCEDLLDSLMDQGIDQYVIMGAGLDSFAQRRLGAMPSLQVFEIDQSPMQQWKIHRLNELGHNPSPNLHLVAVDFEQGEDWKQSLSKCRFNPHKPALISMLGLSMYLHTEALHATLRQIAELAPGTTLVLSFLQPLDQVEESVRFGVQKAMEGAAASGHPWHSMLLPLQIMDMALDAGFRDAQHISSAQLNELYFAQRTDGLRLPLNSEELLIARV